MAADRPTETSATSAQRPAIETGVFDRPNAAMIRQFDGIGTAIAANLGEGCFALDRTVSRLCGTRAIFGPAFTAQAPRGDNLAAHLALVQALPGDVLIVATDANDDCAVIGDTIAAMAANGALAGIITDGLARDLAGLRTIGLPVHARGLCPISPRRSGPARLGFQVELAGHCVAPGDLIIADDDGVAVIRQGAIDRCAARLNELRWAERDMSDQLRNGARFSDWAARLLGEVDVGKGKA